MAKVARKSSSVTIQAVERAAAVMEVFFQEGASLSLSEVAEHSLLAPGTVHRLLFTLIEIGWIEQDPRSLRYDVSEYMLGNAALALASSAFLREGNHFLGKVSEATGLNSYLAVRRGKGSVLLARAQGRSGSSSDFQVGKSLPLYASASGKLFLAFMTQDERDALLADLELRKLTSRTIVERQELENDLQRIRELGYALDRSELYESYSSLAVPIRLADGGIVAALCSGWWALASVENQEDALLKEILPAAEEFSRVYGQFEPW